MISTLMMGVNFLWKRRNLSTKLNCVKSQKFATLICSFRVLQTEVKIIINSGPKYWDNYKYFRTVLVKRDFNTFCFDIYWDMNSNNSTLEGNIYLYN